MKSIPGVSGLHFAHDIAPGTLSAQLVALGISTMPGYHACYIGAHRFSVSFSVSLEHPDARSIIAALALLDIDPL